MQEDYYCDGYTVWYICFVAVFVGSLWAVALVSHARAFAALLFSADNVGVTQGAKSDRSSLACFALTLGLIIIYVRPRPRPLHAPSFLPPA